MPSRLIDKVTKMVTVDYCRLTFVENPDGFLLDDEVCSLLRQEKNIEVIKGSQLALRIHYELHYKQTQSYRYVYICNDVNSLLPDMKREGVKLSFSISDVFPLFADKNLVRKQTIDVLEILYSKYATKRVLLTEGDSILKAINKDVEDKRSLSVATFQYRLNMIADDWNKLPETIGNLSAVIEEAIGVGVIGEIWNDINVINPINESPVIPYNPEVNPVHIQLNNTYVYIRLSVFCEYSVSTVTSNVIQVSDSFLPIPIPLVASGSDVCSGNDIFLSADNVAPGQLTGNTFAWTSDNGFTSNQQYPAIDQSDPYYPSVGQTVTYSCVITNMYGCSASGSTSLTVNSNPTLVVDTVNTNDFTVHAVGGLAPYSYTIDFINFNSDGIFTGLTSGTTYTVYVSDGNACQAQIDVTTL